MLTGSGGSAVTQGDSRLPAWYGAHHSQDWWGSRVHSWDSVGGLTRGKEADDSFPERSERRRVRAGFRQRRSRNTASVLQLRHFIQVRSQHFGSFYIVTPVELFILGVGAVIS